MPDIDFLRIGGASILVLIASVISRWQTAALEKQMLIATARAFVQLIAIGYALHLIFATEHPLFIVMVMAVMILIAVLTAGKRGEDVPRSRRVALIAMVFAVSITIGLLVALDVFQFTAQEIIPVAGMVIGSSMNACSLVMKRLGEDVRSRSREIEEALALGLTRRKAVTPVLRNALQNGMTPIVDNTKTVGLIQFPGVMIGMILAGASPMKAVQLQIVVMYMLLGGVALTSLATALLSYRNFFSKNHQLALD